MSCIPRIELILEVNLDSLRLAKNDVVYRNRALSEMAANYTRYGFTAVLMALRANRVAVLACAKQ
jgi:hypothetical protein